jgi:DNA-binding response OmpR family regulator
VLTQEEAVMSLGVVGSGTLSGQGAGGLSSQPTCLIVEDQALIAMSLEAYLEENGFGFCETFLSTAEALAWLGTNTPSVAIIDYSLKDGPCTVLVRILRERGIPFVIYSGHRREIACRELQDVPWLAKPCDRLALLAALNCMIPTLAQHIGAVTA